ncbi:siphovirus ReqiPepy6 Gp37-like family protein [Lactococcus lactis]|uniref:siphovirus ReqiPepy6 Gp37-like family protein n=1 Tax=Lactococcus lactis TaxID=1358 RepID=UPI00289063AA|nr:siphovirus ReqiPepy6 Gp37-like family protein [Lactococcus lactis]MDT2872872.1 siphovirus ReqiPepy6 Gp37-like family protein [Lactococcus lactis]MDT2934709.1 siphovirus ReqiPepy6 Gp37-like family protein [Lactococcus lactis]
MLMVIQRDLTVEIFNRNLDFTYSSVGILDQLKSCIINWRAFNFDIFQLTLPLNSNAIPYLKSDNIFSINDSYFYIDSISYDSKQSNLMTVKGKSLLGKATKRIVIPMYATNSAKPEKIMFDLINKNMIDTVMDRMISFVSIQNPPDFGLTAISYQNSYGNVAEEIAAFAEGNSICIKEVQTSLETPASQIQFYKGRDLSGDGGVEFSLDDEGLKSESLTRDISDFYNVAYIFGEGEGSKRKSAIATKLPSGKPKGEEVNEIYIDARDLQQTYTDDLGKEVTLTDDQYKAQLLQRGNQALTEHAEVIQIGGEVNYNNLNFQYGKDYMVGDIVRQTNPRFGVSKASTLTEMQETWDESGYHLDPTFDKDKVTLTKLINRK